MKKIKFSQQYTKMLNNSYGEAPRRAFLLETFIVDSKDLHPRFVEYDTLYFDKELNNWAYHKLPKGKLIVLLLRTDYYNDEVMIWTTIRRYTPQKFEYYKNARMEEFEIVIKVQK